jgi:3-hydroxy-9,10-secoandrosta-1,3,5(10)-triene-9,17-dione monooxygenase
MTVLDAQTAAARRAVDATRALIPELAERAAACAHERRLPQANVDAMRAAGSLRTIQSTRNGGLGLGIRTHLDVIGALAEGCGSTAWVAGVVHAHSWLLSHFPAQGQDDVYGTDPDAVVSAVIGPRGRAERTASGFRLSGVWPFASGCERSDWLLLGGVVVGADGAPVDEGDFIVPTSAVTIMDDWYVTGLTGTGSCTVKLDGLDIPEHRFLSLPSVIMGTSPGAGLHGDDWVQRCAAVPVLTIALCGGAIGISRRALAEFPALIKGKTIAYTAGAQDTNPATHVRVAEAAARIHECETLLYRVADEVDEAGRAGTELPFLTRARHRLDCATAVRRAYEGVEILFQEGGASGIRTAGPLGRAFADLQAMNNHGLLKLETNQEMYGRLLLGLEPNTPLI